MTTMEIVLLICGAAIFIISFFVPERKGGADRQAADTEEISRISEEKLSETREKMYKMADEAFGYAREKTEDSLDRLSNEKMMALDEYSESVLRDIEKNHQEVVFLYDMLNEKSVDLKNTVRQAQQVGGDLKDTFKAADEMAANQAGSAATKAAIGSRNSAGVVKPAEHKDQLSAIERLARNKAGVEKMQEKSGAKRTAATSAKTAATAPSVRASKAKPADSAPAVSPRSIDMAMDEGRTPGRNKNEMILKLHREGKSNVEVARELGLGMGEVKLVIDLFEGPKGGAK